MSKQKIYLALVLFLLINTIAVSVYADGGIKEDQNKLDKYKNKMEKNKEKQDELKREAESVSSDIEKLDKQMNKAEMNLQKVQNHLIELNSKIKNTREELVQAEDNIKDKQGTFDSRLRIMYKNSSIGYLEVLFESEDLKDLITRIDMVQKIIEHDVELIKYLKGQRELIKEKKNTLEQQYAEVRDTKSKVEIKKKEIQLVTRSKQKLMAGLERNIKEMEKQYDQVNALAKGLEKEIKRKQLAEEYKGGKMMWPVPGRSYISSPFGWRTHPIFKTKKMHTGIDIPAPRGNNIVAANDGKVQYAGVLGGYGNVVILDHGGGITTLYGHNSRLTVKAGERVKLGQTIAKAGSTGYSTGPHLHFEVRKNGKYTNPLNWVAR